MKMDSLISFNEVITKEFKEENFCDKVFGKRGKNSTNVYDKIKSEKTFKETHLLFNKSDSITSRVEDFINEHDEDQIANKDLCITIMKSMRIVDAYEAEVSQSRFDVLTPIEVVNDHEITKSDSSVVICSLEALNEKINQGAKIPNLNMDYKSSKVEYLTGHDYNVHIIECDSEDELDYVMNEEDNEYNPVNIKNASFETIKPSNVPPYIQTVINFGTPDDPYLHFSIDAIHEKSDDVGLFDDENELDIFPDGVRGLKENILDFNITSETIYNIISLTQEKHPNIEIDEIFTNVHFLFPKIGSLKVLKNVVCDIERQIGKIRNKKNSESKTSFITDSWCNNCCLFMDCTCEKPKDGKIPLSYVTKLPYDDSEYKDMCGVDCYKNKSNQSKYPKDISEYSKLEQIRFKQYYILFGNRSCHIKDTLITDEGVIAKCYRIKVFLDKFCKGLPTKQYIKMTPSQQSLNTYQTFANVARKTILINESEYGNDDKYSPCKHFGECSERNNCPCIKSKHACFNMCQCLPSCPSKFTGCNCKSGNCSTTKCPCVKLGWECVSTYCKNCNCDITIDVPINEMCRNSFLQRGFSKRLDIKESTIAGFGAFATDLIKKGDFISEYKGEIISQEESERRGRVYDSIKMNYLFKLNQLQQVDAYHYGNACRFINHSDTNPNVHAKIIVVSGMQKIALIALRNIDPGEELFFNYNYTKHQTKNFVKNISGPQSMSIFTNKTEPIDFSQINCEICFQNYSQVGSSHSITCLPCGHIFGKNCLIQWLESKKPLIICPKCKKTFNGLSRSMNKFEDYIITVYGLPCSGKIQIEYENTSDKLFQVERELLEVKEENSKLKRELDSLRKNFRYLSSQRLNRVPLVSPYYSTLNGHPSLLGRTRSQRDDNINRTSNLSTRRRNNFYNYLTQISNRNIGNNLFTGRIFSDILSRDNIPEFTINDEEESIVGQIISEDSRDTIPSQPDEIVIISDGEEEGTTTDATEFQEPNINVSNDSNIGYFYAPNVTKSVSFTSRIFSVENEEITDAVLIGKTIVTACKIYEKNSPIFCYGLRFFSSKKNFQLNISKKSINKIAVTKSRNNDNRFNILVASLNCLYIVKFYAIDFSATISKKLKYTENITSLSWITHKEFAFGTSIGKVVFGDIDNWPSIKLDVNYTSTNNTNECNDSITQLQTASHGHVFGVQGNKLFIFHKSSPKILIKTYNVNIKCIDFNENKNKLFCFLFKDSSVVKILSYTVVEHIEGLRIHLSIEESVPPSNLEYNTTGSKMGTFLFEYVNQTNNYLGYFDYDKDVKKLLAKIINYRHNESLDLQIDEEPFKVVGDILSKRINNNETFKFAVITSKEVHVE
uniref:Uncharacterized protein n=1 Tax=Strongyloides stercoralis TaxID=6248 RepID=A0AAF5D4A1_STRER